MGNLFRTFVKQARYLITTATDFGTYWTFVVSYQARTGDGFPMRAVCS